MMTTIAKEGADLLYECDSERMEILCVHARRARDI